MLLENKVLVPAGFLQFFSQDGGGAGEGDNSNPIGEGSHNNADGQQKGDDGSQQQQKQKEIMIPKTRFDEVNDKLKALQAELDKVQKAKEQEELEVKKKKGEFEELYTKTSQELETTKQKFEQTNERVKQLESVIQTLVDAELEAVPEEMRDLVPENFTPEQKLSWITNAKKKGIFGTVQNKANEELGGATNNVPTQQTDVSKLSVIELLKQAYGSKK